MGKSVKERLDETIKRDKREIAEEDNKMGIKGNKETNVEDFMNKKIKEMMDDGEQELEDDDEYDEFEEELEEESPNGKKIIVILLVLIISLSTILVLWSNGYEIVNFLEKGKANHSSILAWRIPWPYSPWGGRESDTTEQLSFSLSIVFQLLSLMMNLPCKYGVICPIFHTGKLDSKCFHETVQCHMALRSGAGISVLL